ncbi:tRNA (guanine-N-7) methyltransferase [Corchorus olitorius]|uniref:tRNA (guanine(46)-N(7))-methyltransferase n=1 Tax=Corchorus olitorius TaxID=93759 RepID=A0A1R3ITC5_9ROSI|nr:tRNA (guanine-N-7) methyltransferase [Corchorus olitorius]
MASSLCSLNSWAVPRAAKQALSSLVLLHKFPSSRNSRAFASASVSIAADNDIRSSDLVALEYADLNLTDKISKELGHVRIRQHVNPLSSSFSAPAPVPDWSEVFSDPTLPLMVDIGCGSGRFLIWLAKQNPDSQNYLGLEIRAKNKISMVHDLMDLNLVFVMQLVKRAEFWVKELALNNIHFIFANATVSFKHLISTYPGPLMLASILCPDPHFKKRHHKRRVVQKPLVDSILSSLVPGGKVFIQSDVLEVAVDMRNQFDSEDVLQHVNTVNPSVLCDDEGWLLNNPMGIRTEREIHAEFEGAKIYRRKLKFHAGKED